MTFLIWHEEIVKDEKSIWDNINTDLVLTGYNHCYGNKTLPLDFLFLCFNLYLFVTRKFFGFIQTLRACRMSRLFLCSSVL